AASIPDFWSGRKVTVRLTRINLFSFPAVTPNHPHPMSFAIADENRAIRVHKNPVRARKLAPERIPFGAVASLTGSSYQFDGALRYLDHSNAVALRVCDVNVPVW